MTNRFFDDDARRLNRRALVAGAAAAISAPLAAAAQDDASQQNGDGDEETGRIGVAEVPSFGARRPGPVMPSTVRRRKKGYVPVAITIPDAAVDAPIELGYISQEGIMQDPSGAWVVSWYDSLGLPGEGGNVVMAGHLDYWDTPQAVFFYLPNLGTGAPLSLVMEDGKIFNYALQSNNLFAVADLTPDIIASQVVGDMGEETLTLITCGGQFDVALQEYLYRYVIRFAKV